MSQFNRIANVVITNPGVGSDSLQIQISKLKIGFDIKKTETSESNTAIVNIYNLNLNTRNLIDKTDSLLTLYAGYKDAEGLSIIFTGDIATVSHKIYKPDIITSIEVNDGERNLQNNKVSISYGGKVTVKQILRDVIKNFGFDEQLEFNKVSFTDVIFNTGFSFAGMTKTVMDKLTKMVGLQWSIQNNELKLYKEESTDTNIIINLSPETGLIGSPEQIKIKTSKKGSGSKQIDGWKIMSLLQPKAEPGGKLKITSRNITDGSEFKILNVNHSGDTHGGRWQTTMQAVEL